MSGVVMMGQYLVDHSASRFLRLQGHEWVIFGEELRADIVDRIENDFLFYMTAA